MCRLAQALVGARRRRNRLRTFPFRAAEQSQRIHGERRTSRFVAQRLTDRREIPVQPLLRAGIHFVRHANPLSWVLCGGQLFGAVVLNLSHYLSNTNASLEYEPNSLENGLICPR